VEEESSTSKGDRVRREGDSSARSERDKAPGRDADKLKHDKKKDREVAAAVTSSSRGSDVKESDSGDYKRKRDGEVSTKNGAVTDGNMGTREVHSRDERASDKKVDDRAGGSKKSGEGRRDAVVSHPEPPLLGDKLVKPLKSSRSVLPPSPAVSKHKGSGGGGGGTRIVYSDEQHQQHSGGGGGHRRGGGGGKKDRR
jgi:hypothetical protein